MDFPFEFQTLPPVQSIKLVLATVPKVGIRTLEDILVPAEIARARRFKATRDGERLIFRRALLRTLVADRLGVHPREIQFGAHPFGKPFVVGGSTHFSLSYSQDQVLIALSDDHQVGVDIEWVDHCLDFRPLVRDYFTPAEALEARSGEDFYRVWTRKESILKAIGTGLSQDISKLDSSQSPVSVDGQLIYHQPVEVGKSFAASVAWFALS